MRSPVQTYDARWEVKDFNDSEILRLFEATYTYARLIGIDTLVFARDARLGCARVMETGIETAVASGFRVYACMDPVSTPLSYFMTMQKTLKHPKTMGLTITASHNPKQYIGVKFTVSGVEAIGYDCGPLGGLAKVKELYLSPDQILEKEEGGSLHIVNHPAKKYIGYSLKLANVKKNGLKGLKVVLDTFHGSAGPELYKALTFTGVEVIPLRLVPNGEFPTGSPNPTSQHKMDRVIQLAGEQDADLVIGVDGDGDRIVFGDKTGIFSAGFVMIPILKSILDNSENSQKQKILYDPKVNPLALKKWEELNAEPVLFRNGHSQIKAHMKNIGALAGAEESGHYYHTFHVKNLEVAAENSLFTILLFLNAVHKNEGLISELRQMQNEIYTSGEFNFQFKDDKTRDEALEAIIRFFKAEGAEITSQSKDGTDLEGTVVYKGVNPGNNAIPLEDEWYSAYIRTATNEKDVVRSYISSANTTTGKQLRNTVVQILKKRFSGIEIE